MNDQMPTVLTVEELAAELRIGRDAAYGLVRDGEVFGRRIGRSIRVPRAALERYLAGEPQVGTPEPAHQERGATVTPLRARNTP